MEDVVFDSAWRSGIRRLPTLTELNFGGVADLDEEFVVAFAESCPLLAAVDLTDVVAITDVACVALAVGCPLLRTLGLSNTDITEVSLCAIAWNCKGLQSVDVSHTRAATRRAIEVLARSCATTLEALIINGTSEGGRASALLHLAETCTVLRHLSAADCTSRSPVDVDDLEARIKQARPRCTTRL